MVFVGGQFCFVGNYEGKVWYVLNVFVGGVYQVINIQCGDIQWNVVEVVYCIDDIVFIVLFCQFGYFFDWIQYIGGGFVVYYCDMGDCWVVLQDLFDCGCVWMGDFVVVVRVVGDVYQLCYFNYMCVIGVIVDD